MKERTARSIDLILRFRRVLSLIVQVALVVAANRIAFLLRFDGASPSWAVAVFWQTLPWLVGIRALTFVPFKLYEGLWRYTSLYDLRGNLKQVLRSNIDFYAGVNVVTFNVNRAGIPAGYYYVKIWVGGTVQTFKVMLL